MRVTEQWDYKTIEVKSKLVGGNVCSEIDEELNALGEQGWELVNGSHDSRGLGWFFFLKRPRD